MKGEGKAAKQQAASAVILFLIFAAGFGMTGAGAVGLLSVVLMAVGGIGLVALVTRGM